MRKQHIGGWLCISAIMFTVP